MTINEKIQIALKYHQRGDLQMAELLCKEILQVQPINFQVLHLLGVVFYQNGDYDGAIESIKKALQVNPNDPDAYFNLGNAYAEKGQLDEALTCFLKAAEMNPELFEAYNNIGNIFMGRKQFKEGIMYYKKALTLNPDLVDTYYNLADAFVETQQIDEAIACYQEILQLDPSIAMSYFHIGNLLQEKGRYDEAVHYYKKAIEIGPTNAEVYNNLGTAAYQKGFIEESITYYQKALVLNPDYAVAYSNIGIALHNKGKLDEAFTLYQKALQINPDIADAHLNTSLIHLSKGNFKEGWKEFEWRWRTKEFVPQQRNFSQPLWDGSDIAGKTILLHAEQGFGDTIQFVRYVPLVAQRRAKVILECLKELKSLIQTVNGIHQVVVRGEPLPEFDLQCPLLRLPLVFNTTLESIPTKIPYVFVDPELGRNWGNKVQDDNSKLKIGITWYGNPKHIHDRNRSCLLETFLPFSKVKDILFYSLQKERSSMEAKDRPEGMKLFDYTKEIYDFSDTAALIENLDLIISVDTAVAHLAGALGKPVWTLLPFVPDWRWLLDREDSPWYPTMRLFRQQTQGDWRPVIARVLAELKDRVRMKDA
jgi:tetratricopeptide (TPR) repeat protein